MQGLVASEFINSLPANETPATTKGFEGFFHLTDFEGDVSEAKLQYIIRDHDDQKFEERKN
jgi:tripeptide aminopeptidase